MRRLLALLLVALWISEPTLAYAIVCTGTGPCTVTVKSTGGDYPSLAQALTGESADLVTATRLLTIECYNFTDSTAATTGTGYTTNPSYYIHIIAPVGQRHNGTPSGGGYLLSGSGSPMLTIAANYTRVTGIHVVTSGSNAIYYGSSTNVLFDKILVKGTGRVGLYTDVNGSATVRNSLAYRCGREGFSLGSGTMTLENVTVAECTRSGVSRTGGTLTATNVLAYHNGDGVTYFDFLGTMTATYCASTDATADDNAGTGNRVSQTFTFLDAANNDFHLASNDGGARDYGTSTGMPTEDVDGETRSGSFDIGFDEYVAAGGSPAPATPAHLWIQGQGVVQ